MNFRLSDWSDEAGALSQANKAERAFKALTWGLTALETPQPIGLDLRDVEGITTPFVEKFFVALIEARLESYFGPHSIVVFGAQHDVRDQLKTGLALHGISIPIST